MRYVHTSTGNKIPVDTIPSDPVSGNNHDHTSCDEHGSNPEKANSKPFMVSPKFSAKKEKLHFL